MDNNFYKDYDLLKLKVKYFTNNLKDYNYENLLEFEQAIYDNKTEKEKIHYELLFLQSKYNIIPQNNKYFYLKLMDLIATKISENDMNVNAIKELIVAIELYYDFEFGFYSSIKSLSVDSLDIYFEDDQKMGRWFNVTFC